MLVRWKERPMPNRQTSCGGMPVMSRPLSTTAPASGRRCPVIKLKNVVLPAPLGPMMAAICPGFTRRLTPATAWNPSKALRTSRTSSTGHPPQPPPAGIQRAHDAAGEHEEQHDEDRPQHERPVLGVRGDLLVEDQKDQRAYGRPPEMPHPAQDGHDEDLGRFRPVGEVREQAAVVDAEEPAGEPGEEARQDEGQELVAP